MRGDEFMKVIILAAGYGSRMYPLAQDKPKCLLTINYETILERQLRILKESGLKDITVVTGFYKEKIIDLYGEEISTRYNPHYEITNSIFSLWVVRDILDSDFIIITSDAVYTNEVINNLLENNNTYCLVIDKKQCDEEARKVIVVDNLIVDISKEIPLEKCYGEFIGMAKVRKEGAEDFCKSLFKCTKKNSNMGWPMVFQHLAKNKYKVNFILIKSPWIEIDTKEDYWEAKKMFKT